jgi:hypothetical protein
MVPQARDGSRALAIAAGIGVILFVLPQVGVAARRT